MLSFVEHSESLRNVYTCDSSWEVSSYPLEPWLNAVADNSRIEALNIFFRPLPCAVALRLFQTTKSLKRLKFCMVPHDGGHEAALNALKSVETLEELEIYNINKSKHRECSSMISNMKLPIRLRSLKLLFFIGIPSPNQSDAETGHLVPQALAGVLRTAPASLNDFTVRCNEFDEVGMHYFLDGLHQSPSVSKLTLECRTFKSEQAVMAFVAYMQNRNGVASHGNGVRTLRLVEYELLSFPFERLATELWGSNLLESLEVSLSFSGHPYYNRSECQDFVQCQRPTLTTLKLGRQFNATHGNIDLVRDLPNLV